VLVRPAGGDGGVDGFALSGSLAAVPGFADGVLGLAEGVVA
jgi:hypothetical protein